MLMLLLDGKIELELGRQFLFGVQSVTEINATDTAVGVNLQQKSLTCSNAFHYPCSTVTEAFAERC